MLRRGMINLVSRRESKNNFDSSDVLTGQVNFGTTKGAFLYFFFRGLHTTQFNQGYCSQRGHLFNHFGTERGMHRQPGLRSHSRYLCVCRSACVYAFLCVHTYISACRFICLYQSFCFSHFFITLYNLRVCRIFRPRRSRSQEDSRKHIILIQLLKVKKINLVCVF